MKRLWIVLLCVALTAAMLPWSVTADGAEPMPLVQLRQKYPHGAYWNHTEGGNEDYTYTPCDHHSGNCTYSGSCGCNTYKGKSIQCMGFAYQLAALAYADEPREWETKEETSALDTLKAGDIVRYRYNGHSIFVTAVAGDTVTYADCNSDRRCLIQWDRTVTIDEIKKSFTYVKAAPYELPTCGLSMTVSADDVLVGEELTVTLRYDGGGEPIGGFVGDLTYHTGVFSLLSYTGDDVEIYDDNGRIRYVYAPSAAEVPTAVTVTLTFTATAYGRVGFTATTEEFINDTDYASLGTPTANHIVAVVPPSLTVSYHGGGGEIANTVVARTYRVLSSNGINMRKDAGTGNAKVTALPNGTVFTVAVGDTKEADGYTWGKTTYNGKTGWVVISDFVEKTGDVWGGEWTLKDGLVCRMDGSPLTHTTLYGDPIDGVADAAAIGLHREGHRFAGWCTAADGNGVTFETGMSPETLCPEGGESVTLYALWNPILAGDADGNGQLNNRDMGLLQRYLNDWEVTLYPETDVDGDGNINNRDLGLLQQMLNEWTMEE